MSDRYNREYSHGVVTFYLSDFIPNLDECKFLMLKVLEQTVRDYCSLANAPTTFQKEVWLSARDFLFDDENRIMWGGLELSTESFLDILDLDIEWVRGQVKKKFAEKMNGKSKGRNES